MAGIRAWLPSRRMITEHLFRDWEPSKASREHSSLPLPIVPDANPFLLARVDHLMLPQQCASFVDEALQKASWSPWDGDCGQDTEAIALGELPHSRVVWEHEAGPYIRAQVARHCGSDVRQVVSHISEVFVCKLPASCARARQRIDHSGRSFLQVPARFRRSLSLVSFCVALNAGTPSWMLCFEEPGQGIRPMQQGAGVIFSGKRRHAVVQLPFKNSDGVAVDVQSQFVLRGFASVYCPQIDARAGRWRWGSPTWHIDSPWVSDAFILNRIHSPSRLEVVASLPGQATNPTHNLERVNSTLAHRYYRQRQGGINVPMSDDRGRPVIDLKRKRPWRWRASRDITIEAVLRPRFPWGRQRRVGRAGLCTEAGTSQSMDAALQELFDTRLRHDERPLSPVPPIKYVFVDPRYRGLQLGRRLFLEAMCVLAEEGFSFALIVVEDNGSGELFGFYEDIGFVRADGVLGIPRAMIAPIPPAQEILDR